MTDLIVDALCDLTKSEHGPSACIERVSKAPLKKNALANKSDILVKDLIWLLFDTSLRRSGFNLNEPTELVQRIDSIIKLDSSGNDDDEGLGDDDDLPLLEEVDQGRRDILQISVLFKAGLLFSSSICSRAFLLHNSHCA